MDDQPLLKVNVIFIRHSGGTKNLVTEMQELSDRGAKIAKKCSSFDVILPTLLRQELKISSC